MAIPSEIMQKKVLKFDSNIPQDQQNDFHILRRRRLYVKIIVIVAMLAVLVFVFVQDF